MALELVDDPIELALPVPKPASLAQKVQRLTADGHLLVGFLVAVITNPKEKTPNKLKAAELLFSRGWGKPKEQLDINITDSRPLAEFAVEELRKMLDTTEVVEAEITEL